MKKLSFFILAVLISLVLVGRAAAQSSPIYWELGGRSLIDSEKTGERIPLRLGAGGSITGLGLCGKFDPKASVNSMFDQIDQLLATLESIPGAILSSLPGYILCRAKPGLCQLLQDYTGRLELQYDLHMRTCEGAVKAATEGDNPYSDWIVIAERDEWKDKADAGKSTREAYEAAAKQRERGIIWVGGERVGGRGQKQLQPVRQVAHAGWCLSQGKRADCKLGDANSIYSHYWQTPVAFRAWLVGVVGDVGLWVYEGAPRADSVPGTGLEPLVTARKRKIAETLDRVLKQPTEAIDDEALEILSSRNLPMTRALLKQLQLQIKKDPNRAWLKSNLTDRIAIAQVVDRAFAASKLLATGRQEPNVQAVAPAKEAVMTARERLKDEIELLLHEREAATRLLGDFGAYVATQEEEITADEKPLSK